MSVRNRRSIIVSAVLFLSLCVAVNFAAARGGGGHGGGGHGGGRAGGHAGGHHGGAAHHGGEHHGGAAHHDGHYAHYGDHHGYDHWGHRGWGGWGGWAGGLGLGAAGAYAYDEPFSVPLDNSVNYDPTYQSYGPATNDLAQDDEEESDAADGGSDQKPGVNEKEDIDHRAAIQLVLPDKDAHVFLNGKLVPGAGTRRLIMTPEIDDDDPNVKDHTFHVLAVWEVNGRPVQREGELTLAAGNGAVLNLTVATTKPAAGAKPATVTTSGAAIPGKAAASKTVASDK